MNNKNANASEITRKYDSAYMEILATEMRREDAREFKKLVEKEGTTVGEKLAGYVREELVRNECKGPYVPAGVTVKNVDRLKLETSLLASRSKLYEVRSVRCNLKKHTL